MSAGDRRMVVIPALSSKLDGLRNTAHRLRGAGEGLKLGALEGAEPAPR